MVGSGAGATDAPPSTTVRAPVPGPTRLPGLDSIRGVAVVAVVAYHLGFLRGGFLGVDLFFVLSGYLVTGLALEEVGRTGTLGVRAFWGRRFRRLAPALLVMVPTVVLAALALGWPTVERTNLATDAFATLTWWANWRQLAAPGGYWSEVPSLFRHAWSLSIEEQFYLVWPLLLTGVLVLTRGRRRVPVAVVAALLAAASATWSVVLAHRLDAVDLSRVYLGSDTRAVAPLLGCLAAALVWRHLDGPRAGRWARLIGAAAAAAMVALFLTTDVTAASTYRNGVLPAAAVLAALTVVGASRWRRADPVTSWLGGRSYGIYLWSWPIQVLVEHRRPDADRVSVALVTIPLTLLLAWASHRFVEAPAQRRRRWAARPMGRRVGLSGATAVAVVALLVARDTATQRPTHQRIDTSASLDAALAPPPTTDATPPTDSDGPQPERVMLIGDSVIWTFAHYAPAPEALGLGALDNRSVIGCGLLSALGYSYPTPEGGFALAGGSACTGVEEAVARGLAGHPTVVLIVIGAWEHSDVLSPGGSVIPARSPLMSELLGARLVDLAGRADRAGARTVLLHWACPGRRDDPRRRDPGFIAWINTVLDDSAREGRARGLRIDAVPPPPGVCAGDDALGPPTPGKVTATADEVHAIGEASALWGWRTWLLPAIEETAPAARSTG